MCNIISKIALDLYEFDAGLGDYTMAVEPAGSTSVSMSLIIV